MPLHVMSSLVTIPVRGEVSATPLSVPIPQVRVPEWGSASLALQVAQLPTATYSLLWQLAGSLPSSILGPSRIRNSNHGSLPSPTGRSRIRQVAGALQSSSGTFLSDKSGSSLYVHLRYLPVICSSAAKSPIRLPISALCPPQKDCPIDRS